VAQNSRACADGKDKQQHPEQRRDTHNSRLPPLPRIRMVTRRRRGLRFQNTPVAVGWLIMSGASGTEGGGGGRGGGGLRQEKKGELALLHHSSWSSDVHQLALLAIG